MVPIDNQEFVVAVEGCSHWDPDRHEDGVNDFNSVTEVVAFRVSGMVLFSYC